MESESVATPNSQEQRLPAEVRMLAERLGARTSLDRRQVLLTQSGTMREDVADKPMRFTASQCIDIDTVAFSWRAKTGPLRLVTVIDELIRGTPRSEVRILGAVRLAGARSGRLLIMGQLMRYMAEIPWSPDAILRNRTLQWSVSDRTLRVSAQSGVVSGTVDLELDGDGRIESVSADRPRMEGDSFVERPWRGRFFDYRFQQERWIPFQAEVGWVLDGQLVIVWRGTIDSWRLA